MQATPSEFADALSEVTQRQQWELKLKSSKVKAGSGPITLTVEYIGISAAHEVSYDFEVMPAKAIQEGAGALNLSSFIVNEVTAMNGGFVRTTSIY